MRFFLLNFTSEKSILKYLADEFKINGKVS